MLENSEIHHLIDLLQINIQDTPNKSPLSDSQKKEDIKYDKELIKKLMGLLKTKDFGGCK